MSCDLNSKLVWHYVLCPLVSFHIQSFQKLVYCVYPWILSPIQILIQSFQKICVLRVSICFLPPRFQMLTKEAKHRIALDRVAAHAFCVAQVPVFAANPQAYIPSETATATSAAAVSAPSSAVTASAPVSTAAAAGTAASSESSSETKADC